MPVTFKSKATGDLLMVSAHAQTLLQTLGKTGVQAGILLAQDMPAALLTLRSLPDEVNTDADNDASSAEDEELDKPSQDDPVSLRKRAWPLMRMIEKSHAAGEPIVWGV